MKSAAGYYKTQVSTWTSTALLLFILQKRLEHFYGGCQDSISHCDIISFFLICHKQ